MLITSENFGGFMEWLEQVPVVALDTETTGLNTWDGARICGISLAHPPVTAYLPFRHGNGENLSLDWLPDVINLIERKECWYGFNAKFDLHMLAADGYRIPQSYEGDKARVEDVMFAAHLVNENEGKGGYGLKTLGDKYLGPDSSKDEEELRTHVEALVGHVGAKAWKGHMWKLDASLVAPYAETDVELTWRLRDLYLPALHDWKLISDEHERDLYDEMNRYGLLFAHVEQRGVRLDRERLRQLEKEAIQGKTEMKALIEELSDGAITNPGSSVQVNRYFDRVGVGTRKNDLLRVLKDHPLSKPMLEYRSADKALTSYFAKYLASVKKDGRLHPTFWVSGTYTGRLSSSDPNMQAVPRTSDDEGSYVAKVKQVVVPTEGKSFIELDLGQAELRIASHYGARALLRHANPKMRELVEMHPDGPLSPMGQILMSGQDLHQTTADQIGVPRPEAKTMNFSAVFGIGYKKYAETYGIHPDRAKKILAAWNQGFPEFKALLYQMEAIAEEQGFIRLDSGRVRRYPAHLSDPHAASSNLSQGTVAEVMRHAALAIDEDLHPLGANLILQVHDSLMLEVPIGEEDYFAREVAKRMTNFHFNPRLTADAKKGDRWGTLTKIKLHL